MSLNNSLLLIDMKIMCLVCGKVVGLFFFLLLPALGQVVSWIACRKLLFSCLISWWKRFCSVSCMRHSPGGALIIPHSTTCMCYNAWQPLFGCPLFHGLLCTYKQVVMGTAGELIIDLTTARFLCSCSDLLDSPYTLLFKSEFWLPEHLCAIALEKLFLGENV